MRIITLAFALASLFVAASAHADDAPPRRSSLDDIELDVGTGLLFSSKDDVSVKRYNVYFAPRLSFHDRVYIGPRVGLSSVDLELRQPKDLPLDVDLSLPWQMSLGFDLRYRQPLLRWLDLNLFYRFEFPSSNNVAEITNFKVHPSEDIPDVDVTLDQVRDHISVVHTWRHFALGATLMAHVGWWHPFIDVGYTSTIGRLSVDFDREAADLLGSAGVNPDRFYDTSLQSVYYSAGSEFDLTGGFRLRTQATVVVLSDSWVVNADAALVIPLQLPD